MVALVVIGQEVVVARLEVVADIVEAADSPGGFGQARKRVGVSDQLGQDAEASLCILVEENVRRVGVSYEDGAELRLLCLVAFRQRSEERILKRDAPFPIEVQGVQGLQIDSIGNLRCIRPNLLEGIGIEGGVSGLGHRHFPFPGPGAGVDPKALLVPQPPGFIHGDDGAGREIAHSEQSLA